MNEINIIDNEQQTLPIELSYLFAQLAPQDVEQFYQSYRLWSLQHDIATMQAHLNDLQQQIEYNAQLMQSVQPSPIALSALAQLQAYGVSNLDLLDRMLERGDSWLDHTVQLLVRCEELGVIRSDYTQWCENALEGAYDWITSMDQATSQPAASEPFDENIEITLIQKLMSEDDTAPSSAGTDLSCPLNPQDNQQNPHEHDLSTSTASDVIAEPDSSSRTTEAISLHDLKVPATIQEEDLEATASSITSDQSTEEIHQVNPSSDPHHAATETTEQATVKQRDDTIYQFRQSPKATDNTISQHRDSIYLAHDEPDDISNNSDISAELPATIDNSISETTNPTANDTEQASQQENDTEEQTATATTMTVTNTVTAHTVKNAEQPEQTTDSTLMQEHLQEDDLALPPVTNTYTPSVSWIEPVVTTTEEHTEQTLQATTTDHKPDISWSNEPIEPLQTQPKKQGGLLARLFHPTK